MNELTDKQCDAIYDALDSWAKEVDAYDFGLPQIAGGGKVAARKVIRAALLEVLEGGGREPNLTGGASDELPRTVQCNQCFGIMNEGNGCAAEGCPIGVPGTDGGQR